MRIQNILSHKKIVPIIAAAAIIIPQKTSDTTPMVHKPPTEIFVPAKSYEITPKDLEGLVIKQDTNMVGGITHRFEETSIEKLRQRIIRSEDKIIYNAPIENTPNIYLEPFGYFFANRPNGKGKRPHLGLDIFASRFSRKPKDPVVIQAPLDGVVISHKRARKTDNVIANSFTMLGADGRKYSFDHLARPDDYKDSIPLPTVGTILKSGDKVGYLGATGETSMWHLHLVVMTDEQLEKQKNSKYWQNLSSQSPYCPLKGQVNPLNKEEAGPIAELLSQYRGGKLNLTGDFDKK